MFPVDNLCMFNVYRTSIRRRQLCKDVTDVDTTSCMYKAVVSRVYFFNSRFSKEHLIIVILVNSSSFIFYMPIWQYLQNRQPMCLYGSLINSNFFTKNSCMLPVDRRHRFKIYRTPVRCRRRCIDVLQMLKWRHVSTRLL